VNVGGSYSAALGRAPLLGTPKDMLGLLFLEPVDINTFRTGAFKLFKCTFPGFKQYKPSFILCLFTNL
jgi:hypothetical protein